MGGDERKPDWVERAVTDWWRANLLGEELGVTGNELVYKLRAAHEEGCEYKCEGFQNIKKVQKDLFEYHGEAFSKLRSQLSSARAVCGEAAGCIEDKYTDSDVLRKLKAIAAGGEAT